jgi:hypothetical protein
LAIGSSNSNRNTQPGAAVPQHLQAVLVFGKLPIANRQLPIADCPLTSPDHPMTRSPDSSPAATAGGIADCLLPIANLPIAPLCLVSNRRFGSGQH